jgi:rhamnulokinase
MGDWRSTKGEAMTDKARVYLAVDLGASSGRVVAGLLRSDRLSLQEVHRFENGPVVANGRMYWDLLAQWSHVQQGDCRRPRPNSAIRSSAWAWIPGAWISACWGRGGELLGNPYHYRDRRTAGMFDKRSMIVPREQIFAETGLQFMELNTLYQLLAMKLADSPLLEIAERLLMIPDLFHWLLTGEMANEFTDVSTTQLYNPIARDWSWHLIEHFGLPTRSSVRSCRRARSWGRCRANGGRGHRDCAAWRSCCPDRTTRPAP